MTEGFLVITINKVILIIKQNSNKFVSKLKEKSRKNSKK